MFVVDMNRMNAVKVEDECRKMAIDIEKLMSERLDREWKFEGMKSCNDCGAPTEVSWGCGPWHVINLAKHDETNRVEWIVGVDIDGSDRRIYFVVRETDDVSAPAVDAILTGVAVRILDQKFGYRRIVAAARCGHGIDTIAKKIHDVLPGEMTKYVYEHVIRR